MWSTNFYQSFSRNILFYMNSGLSMIRAVHTYVILYMFFWLTVYVRNVVVQGKKSILYPAVRCSLQILYPAINSMSTKLLLKTQIRLSWYKGCSSDRKRYLMVWQFAKFLSMKILWMVQNIHTRQRCFETSHLYSGKPRGLEQFVHTLHRIFVLSRYTAAVQLTNTHHIEKGKNHSFFWLCKNMWQKSGLCLSTQSRDVYNLLYLISYLFIGFMEHRFLTWEITKTSRKEYAYPAGQNPLLDQQNSLY